MRHTCQDFDHVSSQTHETACVADAPESAFVTQVSGINVRTTISRTAPARCLMGFQKHASFLSPDCARLLLPKLSETGAIVLSDRAPHRFTATPLAAVRGHLSGRTSAVPPATRRGRLSRLHHKRTNGPWTYCCVLLFAVVVVELVEFFACSVKITIVWEADLRKKCIVKCVSCRHNHKCHVSLEKR